MKTAIVFPGLGLEFMLNRVAFNVLGKDVYWYGIFIATGLVLGAIYGVYEVKKQGLSTDVIYDLILFGLPVAIVCARIYYVLFDPTVMEGGFWKAFAIWEGGIAIYGAVIGAAVVGLIYCKVKKLSYGLVFDVASPGLMIGQIVGRLGNFVNGEVYGVSTNLPWAMCVNGSDGAHPLFAYEMLWMTIGLIAILIYKRHKKYNGEIFWLYVLWYGLGRVWMEGLRDPEYIMKWYDLYVSQLIAATAIVVSLAVLIYKRVKIKLNINKL